MTGPPTAWIVRRSSGLFFFTSAVNCAVVVGAGLAFMLGGGEHAVLLGAVPALAATAVTLLVLASPRIADRHRSFGMPSWVGDVGDGIDDAREAIRRPSWRVAGGLGYLGFDIAVLWATFSAVGQPPPLQALVLGFTIGYLANILPVPGGIGVVDAGLVGALLLYGASAAEVGAAVIVYHAIALWVPAVGGLVAYARLRPRLNGGQVPKRSAGVAPAPDVAMGAAR